MIQSQLWGPDTCKCMIEYQWDDAIENAPRTVLRHQPCKLHADKTDGQDLYTALMQENNAKNIALTEILMAHEELQDVKINQNGDQEISFKEGKEPKWSFDQDRNIIITTDELDQTQKGNAENDINDKLSESSVSVTIQ